MSVIPVTLFFSLLLAGTFVVLFAREHRKRQFASAERDSLLPLADESPRVADAAPASDPAHDSACGCRRGHRRPCADCAGRHDHSASHP